MQHRGSALRKPAMHRTAPPVDAEAQVSVLANPDSGIKFVLGIIRKAKRGLKRGASEVQSVIFDKLKWTKDTAVGWLKDRGFTAEKADSAATFWRFRQTSPGKYKEFRTITPGTRNPSSELERWDELTAQRMRGGRGGYQATLSQLYLVEHHGQDDGDNYKGKQPPSSTAMDRGFQAMLKHLAEDLKDERGRITAKDRASYRLTYFRAFRQGAYRSEMGMPAHSSLRPGGEASRVNPEPQVETRISAPPEIAVPFPADTAADHGLHLVHDMTGAERNWLHEVSIMGGEPERYLQDAGYHQAYGWRDGTGVQWWLWRKEYPLSVARWNVDLGGREENPSPDWPAELKAKVETLLRDWHEAGRATHQRLYPNLDYDQDSAKLVAYKRQWAMLDEKTGAGRAGAFMLNRESGNIYRIKSAYGVPNYQKLVGHLNTVTGQDLYGRRWNPGVMQKSPKWALVVGGQIKGGFTTKKLAQRAAHHELGLDEKQYRIKPWASAVKSTRQNPESSAADLYQEFHGRPPDEIVETRTEFQEHDWLTTLGTLRQIKLRTVTGLDATVDFDEENTPDLCSNETGTQLFVEDGDQSLPLSKLGISGKRLEKESIVVGSIQELTYEARKSFDGFKATQYYHRFADPKEPDGRDGDLPTLVYDAVNELLAISGGTYKIAAPGVLG